MFSIGDKVMYPSHGAGVIEAIEEKIILDNKKKYYVLKMPLGDMRVMIPIDQSEATGIRRVVSLSEAEMVLCELAKETTQMCKKWGARYRENEEKIRNGNIFEIAEVVKNLMAVDKQKKLSNGEKKILNKAKLILCSELMLVLEVNEEEVYSLLESSAAV